MHPQINIVADGRLFRGANGFAAEIGHIIVEPRGPLCGCGNRGCWEQVASGGAIGRMGRETVLEHPRSLLWRLADGDRSKVTGKIVTEAAQRGDEVSVGPITLVFRTGAVAGSTETAHPRSDPEPR